jgi:hypothetical protein
MGHKQYQLTPISDTTQIEGQAVMATRKPHVWQQDNDGDTITSQNSDDNMKTSRNSDNNLLFGNTTMSTVRQSDEVWPATILLLCYREMKWVLKLFLPVL